MKTIAVIAEYNPLHRGHAWFISEARRLSGADAVVTVMSGDFVQRGEPAVFDKYFRAEMALRCGSDLVLELPSAFAASGSRRFAEGAVHICSSLGCVDELWFGSESGEIGRFLELAALLADEPPAYSSSLREQLSAGLSFPAAREAALSGLGFRDAGSFLSSPNNILGLEYCLALIRSGSGIRPQTLCRMGDAYHDQSLHGVFPSATAVRRILLGLRKENSFSTVPEELLSLFPDSCSEMFTSGDPRRFFPVCQDDFSSMLHYRLLREGPASLTRFLDMPQDLASRIGNLLPEYHSFSQFAALLKTRNLTRTQIDRALLHVLLELTQESLIRAGKAGYIRMLGFRRDAAALMTEIKKAGSLPLAAGASELAEYSDDLFASNLYEARKSVLSGQPFIHEFSHPVIRL